MRYASAVCISLCLITACATWTSSAAQRLTGKWRYADSAQSCDYVFAADGTFSGTVSLAGKKVSQFTGRWRVEGDRLMYLYTGDALGRIPAGATDEDKLLKVAPDHFEIEAGDGTRRRYQRTGKR